MAIKYICDSCGKEIKLSDLKRGTFGELCAKCYGVSTGVTGTMKEMVRELVLVSSFDYPLCEEHTCEYFLSGPMTGIEDWNRAAFAEVEQALYDLHDKIFEGAGGLGIYNPASDAPAEGEEPKPHSFYMVETLSELTKYTQYDQHVTYIDAVILLPGWERSLGAVTEAIVASACGIDLVLWEGLPKEMTE